MAQDPNKTVLQFFALTCVALSFAIVCVPDCKEPMFDEPKLTEVKIQEFDGPKLAELIREYDDMLGLFPVYEGLLKLPELKRRGKLEGDLTQARLKCHQFVESYNAYTGDLHPDDIPKFAEWNVPVRLFPKDCEITTPGEF